MRLKRHLDNLSNWKFSHSISFPIALRVWKIKFWTSWSLPTWHLTKEFVSHLEHLAINLWFKRLIKFCGKKGWHDSWHKFVPCAPSRFYDHICEFFSSQVGSYQCDQHFLGEVTFSWMPKERNAISNFKHISVDFPSSDWFVISSSLLNYKQFCW